MKYPHPILHPIDWSMTAKFSVVMLSIALIPMSLTIYSRSVQQNQSNLLVIGVIAVIVSLLMARLLLKPFRLLTKAARALERGNFAPPVLMEVSRIQNDIGYLARVFSHMAARVKAAQEQHINQQVTEILLRELSNADLNWLTAVGEYRQIEAGTVLTQEGQESDRLHIVLDGALTATISRFEGSYLNCVYAQDNAVAEWEIAQLNIGEVVGENLFIDASTNAIATIRSTKSSLILSISQPELATKLKQDVGFAARFYRAIAIILSNRLHTFIRQVGCSPLTHDQPLRGVLAVLGKLNDSDIDWLVAIGQRRKISANSILIHQGRPVDALYIILDGTLSVSTSNDVYNPFVRAFSVLDSGKDSGQEIARLSKGEVVGETPFLGAHLPPATVMALQDSLVLAIPRSQLTIKLQQDIGFAARFYRVLANLIFNHSQELLNQLGYKNIEIQETTSNGHAEPKDELNFKILDQMAIAGTRFDWMLRRFKGIEPV